MFNPQSSMTIERKKAEARVERELARRTKDELTKLRQHVQQLQTKKKTFDNELNVINRQINNTYDDINGKLEDKIVLEDSIKETQHEIRSIETIITNFSNNICQIQDHLTQLKQSICESEIKSNQLRLKVHTLTIIGVRKREIGMRKGHIHLEHAAKNSDNLKRFQKLIENEKRLIKVNEIRITKIKRHSMIYRLERLEKAYDLGVLKNSLKELNTRLTILQNKYNTLRGQVMHYRHEITKICNECHKLDVEINVAKKRQCEHEKHAEQLEREADIVYCKL
jgi:chromosome segregation ATPase